MAGGQERVLRRRIRSIQSTQKITRAQELIAASRIVKAQAAVAAAQPYSESITQVVRDLSAGGGTGDSPLLNPRPEIRRVAFIVVAADRGLSGAYNSSVIREAERSHPLVRQDDRTWESAAYSGPAQAAASAPSLPPPPEGTRELAFDAPSLRSLRVASLQRSTPPAASSRDRAATRCRHVR